LPELEEKQFLYVLNSKLVIRLLVYFFLVGSKITSSGCDKSSTEHSTILFDSIPIVTPVKPMIGETSGIADSHRNKGYLWVQEDSGNPAQLYLLGHNGIVAKTIKLRGITNRDWEELQLAAGKLYLGEIGDNLRQHAEYRFYIFEEPVQAANEVNSFQVLRFQYEDGSRDAEAFLVDPATGDIYIITKSDDPAKIYKLTYPFDFNKVNKATVIGKLTYRAVVGAALSPDGKEAIIKTYAGLQYYKRSEGESILQMFQKPFETLPYRPEVQGEAVTFSINNDGYFTLSEKSIFNNLHLYYYKRK
jgi:hypothetical protein